MCKSVSTFASLSVGAAFSMASGQGLPLLRKLSATEAALIGHPLSTHRVAFDGEARCREVLHRSMTVEEMRAHYYRDAANAGVFV